MRKIVFTGQSQNIEFASRWRKTLFPDMVKEGKELSKKIASYKNPDTKFLSRVSRKRTELREEGLSIKQDLYSSTSHTDRHGKGFNNKTKSQYVDPVRKDRINELADNIIERRNKKNNSNSKVTNSTTSSTSVKTPKSSEVAKVIPPSSATKTSLLTPKAKGSSLGKVGLGAAGLLTAGAVGYGVYRKMRSDKGKKRGSYRK